VALATREMERHGLRTVAVLFQREAAEQAGPPRALLTRYRYGFPDDPPDDPGRLRRVISAALHLLRDEPPALAVLP